MAGPVVERVGNALCLDFTNTVNARPTASRDWFASGHEAETWARALGHDIDGSHLTQRELEDARKLRERVYGIFAALTKGSGPDPEDLSALVDAEADGINKAHLRSGPDSVYTLAWSPDGSLSPLVSEVIHSAVELLTHGPLERLGQCPTCGWLFLDTSKNGRRRWCSMATCGARDKARRHYRQSRGVVSRGLAASTAYGAATSGSASASASVGGAG